MVKGDKKIGRDAITGKFESVKVARENPKTTVVETIKTSPKPNPATKKKSSSNKSAGASLAQRAWRERAG